jgi:hypothetical protein
MVKKKAYLSLEREGGEGYLRYPSPHCGLGYSQSFKRYCIDTTDFGFDQGDFSIKGEVSLASSRTLSSVWALQGVGSRFCFGLF